jgi:predicted CXXCH cytochrome family protein
MEPASGEAVLGDFNDREISYFGRRTRFFKDGGAYRVTTENAHGRPETFTIAYTLGYQPLQQYLVDVGGGRLQALPFAWDTRARKAGGQRWFHLYPRENVTPGSPLFWTGALQNWNHMCGDCHTTGFQKNFVAASERFESRWVEPGDGCESCHGPGSFHVESRRARGGGPSDAGRLRPLHAQTDQIDQCGACHARRVRLHEAVTGGGLRETMLETWRPELPHDGLYFADGQIREEVFEIGSFLQSRMAAKGVVCTDCHDPHTARLKAEGNALCVQCHAPETFDTPKHHFHQAGTPGAQCVSCHMPSRTYMVLDERRDHRLAIPRPDLSDRLGTPNPCVQCHTGRSNAWAAASVARATGGRPDARALPLTLGAAAWSSLHEQADAAQALQAFIDSPANPVLKGAALASIRTPAADLLAVARNQLAAGEPLVRLGAMSAFNALPSSERTPFLIGLTGDPLRAIRLEAAAMLAGVERNPLTPIQREGLDAAVAEYRDVLQRDADRAESLSDLAALQLAQKNVAAARALFEKALDHDPTSLTALVNFADFHRAEGDDQAGEVLLRRALALYPEAAGVHHALGLLLARQKRIPEAVTELSRATQLAPDDSTFAFVYAVSLYTAGRPDTALSVLAHARARFPANARIGAALESYCTAQRSRQSPTAAAVTICREYSR